MIWLETGPRVFFRPFRAGEMPVLGILGCFVSLCTSRETVIHHSEREREGEREEGGKEREEQPSGEPSISSLSLPPRFLEKVIMGCTAPTPSLVVVICHDSLLHSAVQGSAKRLLIGCVNASGKLRQE